MTSKPQAQRNIVDLDHLIKYAINSIKQIEYWEKDNTGELPAVKGVHQIARPKRSAHTPSVKDKYFKRVATHICNELYNNKAKNAENKLELSTFHRYLTKIKNDIRSGIARHNPALPALLADLGAKYPQYSSLINTMITEKGKHVNKVKAQVLAKLSAMDKVDADTLYAEINELSRSGNIEHPIIKYLALTPAQSARRKANIAERLMERKTNKQTYTLGFISDLVKECLTSNNFNELALGVALATGRRAIEVIYRGEFTAKGANEIIFTGQAKKGKGVITKPYNIPVIFDAGLIVSAVERLRKTDRYKSLMDDISTLPDNKRNDRINVVCARMLGHTAKRKLTPTLAANDSPVKFKDTRVIALQVAILKIMPLKKYSKLDINEFAKRFEGHDGYDEFANYQHISVIDAPAPKPVAKKAAPAPAPAVSVNADISALEAADESINTSNSKPLYKLHARVKDLARRTGLPLTQTFLYKGQNVNGITEKAGGSLDSIKKYLALPYIAAAVEEYNKGKV